MCNFSLIKKALIFGLLFLGLLAISAPTWAQSTTDGAIGGTVTDPSGAVVPGASISVVNVGTNAKASGTTDGGGRYVVIHLAPGVYTVEISAAGFGVYRQENVTVEVGRTTTIEASLGLAKQTQTVVATAEAPVLTTDRPDFSTNINQQTLENLPVYSRRWSWFALGTPGATPDGNFGLVSFRGISGLLNNNTVDGADNNQAFFSEERGRTRISYSTSEAAIQEFQVNTSNYSAEYGRAAGGVVNAVTKSGTNTIHGQAFWYDRSSDWGAINPFSLHRVTASSPLTPFQPEDKRHQFGGAIGGRIIKDKLFWFFSADQQLRPFPGIANSGTPGAIFAPITVAAPAGGLPCPLPLNANLTEGNVLACRGITQAQTNSALTLLSNLTGNVPRRGDQLVLLPKIDWAINSKNHASFSYNRFRWNSPEGIQTAAIVFRGVESFGGDFVKDDWGIAKLVTTISPNMTNEFRYQYGRDFEFETGQSSIPGEPVSQLGASAQITVGGVGTFVFGTPNFLTRPKYPDERRNQFADTIAWNHGAHLFKFGVDLNHVHDTEINLFTGFGAYSYNNRVDYISDLTANTAPHAQYCGTLAAPLPCYLSFTQGFGTPGFDFSTNDLAFFVQDDWRIKPRLTINLGLRWDSEFLPSPQIPNSTIPGTSSFASDRTDFGPRLGFAWDMTGNGKTILRGGYGIFYGRIINSTIFNAIANTGVPAGQSTLTLQPNQAGSPLYPLVINAGSAPLGLSIIQFGQDSKLPLVHEFDLEVERQIATNTVVSVSYIGSLGRRLPRFVDRNLAAPTLTTTYTVSGGPLAGQKFTVPYFGVPTASKVGTSTGRPNNAVGPITDISYNVNSNYNALVVAVNRRFYKNLQWQSSFTWSRANDFGQASQTFTASNNVLNPFDLNGEYSRSNFDIRDRFSSGLIWTPDYYKGDKSVLKYLLTGYTISPIISIATGAPYTPSVSGNAPNPVGFTSVTSGTGILADGGTNRPPFFGPNSFQMPGYRDVDLRLQKSFNIWESWKVSLIGDAFNLFNHNNVTGVNTQMFSISGSNLVFQDGLNNRSTFGQPTSSSNTLTAQRQIQVGIKLDF